MSPKRVVSTGIVTLVAVSFMAPHLEHVASTEPSVTVMAPRPEREHDDPHTHSPEHSTDSTFEQMSANVAPGGSGSAVTVIRTGAPAALATLTLSYEDV